jgi:hypothetical protein
MHPAVHISQSLCQPGFILLPGHSIHPRRRLPFQPAEAVAQECLRQMMEQIWPAFRRCDSKTGTAVFSSRGRNEPRGEPLLEARSLFKSLSFQSVMDGTRKKHADFIHLIVALGEIPAKIQRRPLAGIKPRPLDVRRNAGQAILAERTR